MLYNIFFDLNQEKSPTGKHPVGRGVKANKTKEFFF